MRKLTLVTTAILAGMLAACGAESSAPVETQPTPTPEASSKTEPFEAKSVTANVIDVEGNSVGLLEVFSAPEGLLLRVSLTAGAIQPGWHGIHLHQVPDCSDVGEFKLSGGHVGKVSGGHGLLNPAGPEGGDMPNIYATIEGAANAEIFTPFISMSALEDNGGFAMIIHEGPDDHITQPIGGAGARVACAAVQFETE